MKIYLTSSAFLSSPFMWAIAACFLFIVLYKIYFVSYITYHKDSIKKEKPQLIPIVLVIAVKNEAKNLPIMLKSALTDSFLESGSKVLVVDDYSSDVEKATMSSFCAEFQQVDFIPSQADAGKKHAVKYAVSQSSAEYFAFTDADCRLGNGWYAKMSDALQNGDFVMGYAPFFKKKGWLNALQRYECMWIACQYMAYAQKKMPYMAVGRNMAASAKLLKETMPHMKAEHLRSGDDDMLVQALNKNCTIELLLSKDSFAYSEAESTYPKYLSQKRRQITTSVHYKPLHQLLLGGISTSLILFYTLCLVGFFIAPGFAFGSVAAMGILNMLIFWVPTQKLKEQDLRWKLVFLEWIYVIHIVILGIYSIVSKNRKWK